MQLIGGYACFAVDNPQPIIEVMPDIRRGFVQGKHIIAVPHTTEHMALMRGFGLAAPSPILERYDWPGKFKPFKHQIETARFLAEHNRAFLLSGMGTGKTASALWAADYLMHEGVIKRCLIAAPLSCLERVWGDALYQNFPHRKFVVLHGTRQARLALIKQDWDFAIVNHHGLGIIGPELPSETNLLIFDEIAVFRNHNTKLLYGEAKKLMTPSRWAWGLTGSPTPNAPTDAWALSKLLTPERYNGSFTRFKMETMYQVSQFKWAPRRNAEEMVNHVLQPSIRYALEDCVDLPPTIYQERQAALSQEQQLHYLKLKREAMTEVGGTQITAVNSAVLLNKLVQAATGCIYGANGAIAEIDFGPRLEVLKECIDESGGKCLVFVPLTGVLHALYEKLKRNYSCAVVEGATSASKRNEIFKQFQESPNPRVLLANPATMAHGLTLTAAATTIWYAPITSHEYYCQANARTARPGQTKTTNIIHISAAPVEHKLYQALKERGRFQDCVLELAKER